METRNPTISTVIPAYNAERFLARALRSALNQENAAHEIIVVDDGSEDRTAEIAASFSDKVRYIRQDNAGVSAARNRGIEEARGEFIAFLDADDEWLPQHLQIAMQVFRTKPELRWFFAAYEKRLHGGRRRTYRVPDGQLSDGVFCNEFFLATVPVDFAWTGTMVIRASIFEEMGTFDTEMRVSEDRNMWFRIGLRYPQVGYSPEVAAIYWHTEQSLTKQGSATAEHYLDIMRRSEDMATRLGPESVARSAPLLAAWMIEGIRQAIREGNSDILRRLIADHGRLLPLRWSLISAGFRAIPRSCWPALVRAGGTFRRWRINRTMGPQHGLNAFGE